MAINAGNYIARINAYQNSWEDALDILREAAADTRFLGISDADQRAMMKVIQAFQERFPAINIDKWAKSWDLDNHAMNLSNYETVMQKLDKAADSYRASAQTTMENFKQEEDKKWEQTWAEAEERDKAEQAQQAISSPSYSAGGNSSDWFYQQQLAESNKRLDEIKAQLDWANEQLNKKWTADELAEYYNVQDLYDYDRLLRNYNDSTNEFYDDYAQKYNQLRTELTNESWRNAYNNFADVNALSKYQAGTQSNRGTNAAVELASQLGTQQNIMLNDYDNLQLQNANEANRQYELANNSLKAQQDYNAMAATLMSAGTNLNDSLVRQAMAADESYSKAYADYRNAVDTQYKGYSSRYIGLANAAATNAQAAVNRYNNYMNSSDYMYKLYTALLGNPKSAAQAVGNLHYANNSTGNIWGYN